MMSRSLYMLVLVEIRVFYACGELA
jgi:hypothetical protein